MTGKLFFERLKEKRGDVPSEFSYDQLPEMVRRQIVMILKESSLQNEDFAWAARKQREAIGSYSLADGERRGYLDDGWSYSTEVFLYFEREQDPEKALSILELLGDCLRGRHRGERYIERINDRMLRSGIGWKLVDGFLASIEDETFFNNVTEPCFSILGQKGFTDALGHYRNAYIELKDKKYDDALTDCAQAIESLIKTRLAEVGLDKLTDKNWNSLKPLLKRHIVMPAYMDNYQNNLIETMGGLLTARNKDGAHGKEEGLADSLDEAFVRFAINQTSSNLLFLAEAKFRR